MSGVPLIIVVGGDALAVRVCGELCGTQGHRVTLLWMHDRELDEKLRTLGAAYVAFPPNDYDALRAAGVAEAASIMLLDEDDRLNLQVGLKARDLNPGIRIVLRQFNRTLGRKIEQNLPNCSVLSLSAHAAATYAAAALDRSCFYALQFPDQSGGVLVGFSKRPAAHFGVGGQTVAAAEQRLDARIIGIGATDTFPPGRVLDPADEVIVFGRVTALEATAPEEIAERREERRAALAPGLMVRRLSARWRRADPIIKRIVAAAAVLYVCAVGFFTVALHRDVLTAAYFVNTTMTTTGYGDITPLDAGPLAKIIASLVMFGGVGLTGIFIAFAASALTRAQWISTQGLRRVRTAGHVLVCGAGNVGTLVIDFLLRLGKQVVVVDINPSPALVELSRNRHVLLLTGDATHDLTLDLCNLQAARALVALTDSDTANLEVTLGARARHADLPVVMRVQDDTFAGSIARQFQITTTFSTAALAAPVFAGLSRFPGSHGRIAFGSDEYNIGERLQGEVPEPPPADHCIALGVWRNGRFRHISQFSDMEPFDRLLFVVPLSQFRMSRSPSTPAIPEAPVAPS